MTSPTFQSPFEEEPVPGNVKCIIGLGNPGARYRATRHNIGRDVAGSLVESLHGTLHDGNGEFVFSEQSIAGNRFFVVIPSTYMNESGLAVIQAMEQFEASASELAIVYDDFQLPLGTLRIRNDGSNGGHNGLASIIYHLQTENIPRLRIGIAGATCPSENRKELMADYVLSPFEKDEARLMLKMTEHARTTLSAWVQNGMQYAMNNFNRSFLNENE